MEKEKKGIEGKKEKERKERQSVGREDEERKDRSKRHCKRKRGKEGGGGIKERRRVTGTLCKMSS